MTCFEQERRSETQNGSVSTSFIGLQVSSHHLKERVAHILIKVRACKMLEDLEIDRILWVPSAFQVCKRWKKMRKAIVR